MTIKAGARGRVELDEVVVGWLVFHMRIHSYTIYLLSYVDNEIHLHATLVIYNRPASHTFIHKLCCEDLAQIY